MSYGNTQPSTEQQLEAMRLQQQLQMEQQRQAGETARIQAAEAGKTDRLRAEREALVASRQASAASFANMMQAQAQQSASEAASFQQMMSSMGAPRGATLPPGFQRRSGPSGLVIGLSIAGGLLVTLGVLAVVLKSASK